MYSTVPVQYNTIWQHTNEFNERSAQERRKHCALAVVMRSQKISPHRRPPSRGRGRPKFNQLEITSLERFSVSPCMDAFLWSYIRCDVDLGLFNEMMTIATNRWPAYWNYWYTFVSFFQRWIMS